MKKIIKKFWGVALLLVLLSTLFVGAVPQAAAGNYAFTADTTLPALANFGLWANNFVDISQSGSIVYGGTGAGLLLYKSFNGGANWIPWYFDSVGFSQTSLVAVAPDDPNIVGYVDTSGPADLVYLSNDGGLHFSLITTAAPTIVNINDISISYNVGLRYVAVGGNDGVGNAVVEYWTLGVLAPFWTTLPVAPTGINDVMALDFSTNFPADSGLIVVSVDNSAAFGVYVEVYSFNLVAWNPAGMGFPRALYVDGTAITCARAEIAMDVNFYLGDPTQQVGFIAAQITSSAPAEVGGVFRFDISPITGWLTQIYVAGAANTAYSIAWDGTNLMLGLSAPVAGTMPVYRCANALAPAGWAFSPNSPLKTPGTGTNFIVRFIGGFGFCFSTGTNNAVARTTDFGRSFNGITLVNSNFALILDFWVSPDGSRVYVIADDGVDINLWRKSGTAWERIAILAGGVGTTWIVRADKDTPDTVYIALQGGTTIYKSLDAGASWIMRASPAAIQDLAVQDANTVYVATQLATATVAKSTNGAFTWVQALTGLAFFADTCYSLNLIADNQLIVGGNAGLVAYSTDGNATWSVVPAALGAASTITAASGLANGDVIWAGDTGGAFGSWTIGVNTATTGWTIPGIFWTPTVTVDGLVYANGILYVWDNTTPQLERFLYPTLTIAAETDLIGGGALNFVGVATTTINALQYSTGSTTLYGRDFAAPNTIQRYTEYLIGPSMAPVPVYPINDTIMPVNSLNGNVIPWVFKWTAPVGKSAAGYLFDVMVYLDKAGTILVGSSFGVGLAFDGGQGTEPSALGLPGTPPATLFIPAPGYTYYWQVRVAAGFPLQSFWSPMQSFSIQQLVAIVPTIASPINGGEVNTTTPAFSWSPISGATSYRFELATDAAFSNIIYTVDPATAGASVPSSLALTRGNQYFWHVKVLTPAEGEWSATANFIVAQLPPTSPTPTTTIVPTPTYTVSVTVPPGTTQVVTVPPAEVKEVNPSYIWAIIIVGAVLVIAVIVLIVRTRRTV